MTAIASVSSSGQEKTAKKSIDWGPLGTPSMSRLIQTEICKGRDDNIRFVYNLWGHILDHKPFEEIQKVHTGGIAMSKIAYSSAMTFLDVFLPYMRQQRPDMLFLLSGLIQTKNGAISMGIRCGWNQCQI